MRFYTNFCIIFLSLYCSAFAQDSGSNPPQVETKEKQAEKRKADETQALMEQARARQRATDQRINAMWERWTYAICIGCGWVPRNVRIVHTYPLRVLAGIPAAVDDARERGPRRRG